MDNGVYVLVTTDSTKRGVFVGELAAREGDCCTLLNARNCVYWSPETHGVFGIAANGPAAGSRIGPRVDEIDLVGVTSVTRVSADARNVLESEPWD